MKIRIMKRFSTQLSFFTVFFALLLMSNKCDKNETNIESSDPITPKLELRFQGDYSDMWKKVDSLERQGLYRSALDVVKLIDTQAEQDGNYPELVKALIHQVKFNAYFTEEDQVHAIGNMQARIAQSKAPLTQILHTITAQLYWGYYSNNQWKFLNRTRTDNVDQSDIRTWDLYKLAEEVRNNYLASLSEAELLQQISINDFDLIIENPSSKEIIRPTLYDFLAHEALNFFESASFRLPTPIETFSVDNPSYFGTTQQFSALEFSTPDSLSTTFYAFLIHRNLARFHIQYSSPEALIQLALRRLNFVKNHSTLSDKESLYYAALGGLVNEYPSHPYSAEAFYYMARVHYQRGSDYSRENETHRFDKKKALEMCEETITRFPNSFGANQCSALKTEIVKKALSFKTDFAESQDNHTKLQVNYTNIDSLYFKVVAVSWDYFITTTAYREDLIHQLNKLKTVTSWGVKLTDYGDYQSHSMFTAIPPMEKGCYVVMASPDKDFSVNNNAVAYSPFWSTELTVLNRDDDKGVKHYTVVNRTTGEPVKGAQVQLYERSYDYTSRDYKVKKAERLITDNQGLATVSSSKDYRNVYVHVSHGKDEFSDAYGQYLYRNYSISPRITYTTNLFTDRKIYRPGQTIYFKGILMSHDGDKHEIQANKSGKVIFFDVNNQKISEVAYTSNEYGSFSGSFVAPVGVVNGTMRITDENRGSVTVSVEEYKRPQFEVKMLPLEGAYKLGETILVKGEAKNYAGSVVDGAKVSYRIQRTVRFPWWHYQYYRSYTPQIADKEIANGVVETNEKGEFEIRFEALKDASTSDKYFPTYNYTISVDVTDITGETQSTKQSVSVASHALNIDLRIPEKLNRTSNNSFVLSTTNLNGLKLAAKGQVTIHRLQEPTRLLKPNQQFDADYTTFSATELKKIFPYDDFNNERQTENLKKGNQVFKENFNTAKRDTVRLSDLKNWKAGRYVAEVTAVDSFGVEVKDVKYFTLFDFEDKTPVTNQFWWVTNKKASYEPGEKATFLISSAAEKLHVLVEAEDKTGVFHKEWITLGNRQRKIEFEVKESHRGNFAVRFNTVIEGQFFSEEFTVSVPYSNKKLDVQFETFRNKLLPGQEEEWKVKIKGPNGEKVAAELLAAMYDASLDQFMSNSFSMSVYGYFYPRSNWKASGFDPRMATLFQVGWNPYMSVAHRSYPKLNWFGYYFNRYYHYEDNATYMFGDVRLQEVEISKTVTRKSKIAMDKDGGAADEISSNLAGQSAMEEVASERINYKESESQYREDDDTGQEKSVQVRTNLNETAFFFPHLTTNAEGEVLLNFTIPEALTRWKFISMAHTKDLKVGYLTDEVVTQKELMVMPNAPRFMREGDNMMFAAKVANLSDNDLTGTAKLEFFDVLTMQPIGTQFGLSATPLSFEVKKAQSTSISWKIEVPLGVSAIVYRITASAANFSDGEENALPILSNRMLVTESMPLPSKGIGTKVFTLEKLKKSGSSTTIKHHQLTLEYTSNPAWYAVQAMPYMMEYPYECAEQIFTRFYANSLATSVMNSNPKIQAVFEEWKAASPDAFLSNLEKNQELKSLMLEETPWVMNAQRESERKKRIGLLFDLNRMGGELQASLRKLEKMQVANGGWSWFPGMPENRYITQHIVTGMGHLDRLGVKEVRKDKAAWRMLVKAIGYLDKRLVEDYEWTKKQYPKTYLTEQHVNQTQIQYFYARSFFNDVEIPSKTKEAHAYYMKQMQQYWLKFGLNSQAMIALATHRYDIKGFPEKILASLKERSILHEELGMYWKDNVVGYYWYQAPIENQALFIEAFDEITNDTDAVEEMKVWLLKQKQTTDWKTTKATAGAVYALLMRGTDLLINEENVQLEIAGKRVDPEATGQKAEAGTGYFKKSWSSDEVTPEMAEVKVTRKTKGVSWGALYWQYFEDLDKITTHNTPLKLNKQLFVVKLTPTGEVMSPVTNQTVLKPGDKIRIRIELRTDRDMEYVHMKDMRAAGFEPINVFSRFKYQGGIGYYESTKDAATNFFIDYLRKGTYVFEYDLRANLVGDFSNGITTIQCMYAPEFTSHSEGVRVRVE